ncbi:MAG: hypothetical protein EBR42_11375 [Betaproteobacteria bacterium]|nr:hypothetical protein [Betaproteobacteria bacterium]
MKCLKSDFMNVGEAEKTILTVLVCRPGGCAQGLTLLDMDWTQLFNDQGQTDPITHSGRTHVPQKSLRQAFVQ